MIETSLAKIVLGGASSLKDRSNQSGVVALVWRLFFVHMVVFRSPMGAGGKANDIH